MVLLDPLLDAGQALEYGLVNRVVKDSELEKVTLDIACQLSMGTSLSYAIAKENMNNALYGLLERQLELERKGVISIGKTMDFNEGLTAFFEKRKPNYVGR